MWVDSKLDRFLCWVNGVFKALFTHANCSLKEVVHLTLLAEVPRVSFIPATHNQFATIQEPGLTKFRYRSRFVPDKELEGVIRRVKGLVPFAYQVIAAKCKNIASGF